MLDNYIYLYLRGTSIKIEIKHNASTRILYNKINDLIDYADVKLIVYNNKPIKSVVNITLMDYNIQKYSYIDIRIY